VIVDTLVKLTDRPMSLPLAGAGITPDPRMLMLRRFPRHDGNTFAAQLDSRRPRQVAQSEIGHLDKPKLRPDLISPSPKRSIDLTDFSSPANVWKAPS